MDWLSIENTLVSKREKKWDALCQEIPHICGKKTVRAKFEEIWGSDVNNCSTLEGRIIGCFPNFTDGFITELLYSWVIDITEYRAFLKDIGVNTLLDSAMKVSLLEKRSITRYMCSVLLVRVQESYKTVIGRNLEKIRENPKFMEELVSVFVYFGLISKSYGIVEYMCLLLSPVHWVNILANKSYSVNSDVYLIKMIKDKGQTRLYKRMIKNADSNETAELKAFCQGVLKRL